MREIVAIDYAIKSVAETIEEVCDEMCKNYCKHQETYNPEEHDGVELMESEICANCPLNRLN